jgi:predicted XRE-type DNA-binding protein
MDDEPVQSFASVWDALCDTPEHAADMRQRADLVIAIHQTVEARRQSRAEAAARFGVSLRRLNDLLRGRLEQFPAGRR